MLRVNGKLLSELKPTEFPFSVKIQRNSDRIIKSFNIPLDNELSQSVFSVCKHSSLSLYVLLMTTLKTLLYRISRNDEIIISSPAINSTDKNKTNKIFIWDTSDNNLTFRQLLMKTGEDILSANKNLTHLNDDLLDNGMSRDNFIFLDRFTLNLNTIHKIDQFDDFMFDILFAFEENGENISLCIQYNDNLIEKDDIIDFSMRYFMILKQSLSNADKKIINYNILDEIEQSKLLNIDNDNDLQTSTIDSVINMFNKQVIEKPMAYALYHDHKYMTYKELNDKSNQLAHIIVEKGVEKDEIIGIMMESSIDMIVSIIAIMKAGCAYLPISPTYPKERVVSLLNDSNVRLLLSKSNHIDVFPYVDLISSGLSESRLYITKPRAQIKDLDSIQIPDRSFVDYEKYTPFIGQSMVKNSITLQFSRGCMFKCAYCFKIWPDDYIIRSAENIFNEMKIYYDMGIRRFGFVDDLPNFNIEVSSKLYQMIIDNNMEVQLHYPNGIRGDILTKDYIDLMIKAGAVNIDFALETTSKRLQKLIRKNLNIERLKENIDYIIEKYPQVILQLQILHGIPTETEEESKDCLEFIKSLKWIHFPYMHILKIFPNTEMAKIAIENGVSPEDIESSSKLGYHELPTTLPFSHQFTKQIQSEFLNEYFLSKERLLSVLPYQMKILTEDELVDVYNGYLPTEIRNFQELLDNLGLTREELAGHEFLPNDYGRVEGLNLKIQEHFGVKSYDQDALKVLLLDVSQYFSDSKNLQYDVYEPPLGLIYLMTSIYRKFGSKVNGKIAKSRMDYDSFDELRELLNTFKPDVIGIRSLNYYSNFFHMTVVAIRQWGFEGAILAGGPYATSSYEQLLKDENVDMVLIGEGENTINEVLEAIIKNDYRLPKLMDMSDIPGIAFLDPNYKSKSKRMGVELFPIDLYQEVISEYPSCNPENIDYTDNLAYIIYTSGSTGKPKGVKIRQDNLSNQITGFIEKMKIEQGLKYILLADFTFDVSVMHIFMSLTSGGTLHLISDEEKKTPHKLWAFIKDKTIDVLNFTPTYLDAMLDEIAMQNKYPVKYLYIGGEAFSSKLLQKINCCLEPEHIFNIYGPTETTINATVYECKQKELNTILPIGEPLPQYYLYVLDQNQALLPKGYIGELYISGQGVSSGYINDQDLTQQKFIANPYYPNKIMYRTGDLVQWSKDGNLLFCGREDNQVKVRGFRIELGEITHALLGHASIKDAVVIARADKTGNNSLYAYVVLNHLVDWKEIKSYLSSQLPYYMVPTHFIEISSIPYTLNGKLDIHLLPETEVSSTIIEDRSNEQNPIYENLTRIWQDILGLENITLDDNFFELGGHSLNAAVCISRVKKELNIKISIRQLFMNSTIRSFGDYIQSLNNVQYDGIQNAPNKEYYPVSNAQLQIILSDKLNPESTCYNVSIGFMIDGKLDEKKLQYSYIELVKRHNSLRTSFQIKEEGYVQYIHQSIEPQIEFVGVEGSEIERFIDDHMTAFNFGEVPLFKIFLLRINDEKSVLFLHMHHVILDGASLNVFCQELSALYNGKQLPNKTISYKDYSEWLKSDVVAERIHKQENYWLKKMEGYPLFTELPLDFRRPNSRNFDGSRYVFYIEQEDMNKLETLRSSCNVTWFMLLLSAYYILLSKITSQEDIVIGIPVSVRPNEQLERLLGVFLNLLPMRNYPKKEMSFVDFLNEVKEHTLSGFENQEYPYVELIKKLKTHKETNRNPVFEVMFDMSNFGSLDLNMDSLKVTQYPIEYKKAKYDLSLFALTTENEIQLTFEYSTSLFNVESISYFASKYLDIIKTIIKQPDVLLSEIGTYEYKDETSFESEFKDITF
ncbi:B12-binding domain-containing radical SAM protein [Lachnoclostridium phytofermentans]|uniref:B12-binding domain-containing radical SAM protein n=1 Tax=Lachnoclostridium phytofermentans TaxID=66219 RepID=UPI0004967AA6|nr:B12-binding domain-containing radical SAM protein [Lachnoclostridium phytofermentans]